MASEERGGGRASPGEPVDQMLSDMLRDADDYYAQLKRRYAIETRVHVAIVGAVVWFAVFVVLGVGVYFTIPRGEATMFLFGALLAAVATGIGAGLVMYAVRRRRGFKFAALGDLLTKMKQGKASSEDGLHLIDVMHGAMRVARKQRLDSAFEYGVGAFILVTALSLNAGFGALAGVIVYLYFRFETVREYEREDAKYEASKRDILLSM